MFRLLRYRIELRICSCVSCALMPLLSIFTGFAIIQLIGQPIIRATDRTELARVHDIDDTGLGCCGVRGWGAMRMPRSIVLG